MGNAKKQDGNVCQARVDDAIKRVVSQVKEKDF